MDISAYQHMNIRMSTRGKRPLRNLTPSDKVRAIQRIHNGETKASVSRDIGVPESTLRGWCKNEQKLRFMCRQLGSDQMSLSGLDNPPEKRLKFDGSGAALKFTTTAGSLEDFGYNRLPLSPMDIAANNAILEKIAFNEFMKKNALATEASKHLNGGGAAQLTGFTQASLPADYSQLAMMQNFNLLSLLNPNLAAMPVHAMGPGAKVETSRPKAPLRAANSAMDNGKASALSTSTGSTAGSNSGSSSNASSTASNGSASRSSPTLSVKNWAKDPSEASSPVPMPLSLPLSMSSPLESSAKRDLNDTNNNDVKSNTPMAAASFPEAGMFPTLFPGGMPPIPAQSEDSETSNAALMDWCKVFNASLNFLALAAAAAALQQPGAVNGASAGASDDAKSDAADNILFKHLTKNGVSQSRDLSSPSGTHILGSDLSNDSYFDSEPEDLSVRSTNSKISSPANSRSQSPTLMSSSSANSDAE